MLRPFHRRVADPRREVFIDIAAWSELETRGREMNWFSLWSPMDLAHFDRITLLGNRLMSSATVKLLTSKWTDITWERIPVPIRRFAFRRVKITYFAESHCASRALFDTERGQRNLKLIAKATAPRVCSKAHIWTCNDRYAASLEKLGGTCLKPRQSGSNSFANVTDATMIYTAKPDSTMRGIYRELGVDPLAFTLSAEREALLQFACRTSLRRPDDQRTVHLRVYDKEQAEYLRECLESDPRAYVTCEVELENLLFAYDVRDSRPGRRKRVLGADEAAAKKVADLAKDRERKRRERASRKFPDNDHGEARAA